MKIVGYSKTELLRTNIQCPRSEDPHINWYVPRLEENYWSLITVRNQTVHTPYILVIKKRTSYMRIVNDYVVTEFFNGFKVRFTNNHTDYIAYYVNMRPSDYYELILYNDYTTFSLFPKSFTEKELFTKYLTGQND